METGIIITGVIKSAKMTTAGKLENGNTYGNSLKVKIEIPILTTKIVAGEEISIEDLISIEQKIKFESEESMLKKYKQIIAKKGQTMSFKTNLKLQDGASFWAEFLQDTKQK